MTNTLQSAMDAIDRVLFGVAPALYGTLDEALAYTEPTRIDAALAEPTQPRSLVDIIKDMCEET